MRSSDWSSDVCSSDLLDAGAERARSQFEAKAFIGIARIRLDIADDAKIEQRERERIKIRHPEEPPVGKADRAHGVEFGRQRKFAKSQQNAEHQADGDAKRPIFGTQDRKSVV